MKQIGYQIVEELYNGEKSIVYRAKKENQSVIIKILQNEYPDTEELNAFRQEYELLKKVKHPTLVNAIGFEKYKNGFAIVFEDIGGMALSIYLENKKKFSLSEILSIAIKVTQAIREIHLAKIVHRDIKPHNIVLNAETGILNVIDLGSGSLLSRQNSFIPMHISIEGTLTYISPEQTGRMNRTVDYRTDFYSLGVTLYQLLTGVPPFSYSDPMELVHAHISKIPIPPRDRGFLQSILQANIYQVTNPLSDIVMKLLQKNPEDRYQNVEGLLYDLEWCLTRIQTPVDSFQQPVETRLIPSLQVGANDNSPIFQIPEKLYGRNKEVTKIMKAFTKVLAGNKELLLISGKSGIGKTILINEINKPIVESKGYFISGKYDQFKRSTPYRAIVHSLQGLVEQILSQSNESVLKWKIEILNAVEGNAQILIDVIPELENLIGTQNPVLPLGAEESENRFKMVFKNFIKVFCKQEHPIAIFLDDLQWADTPSIKLIQEILLDSDINYILFLFSFRDNEISPLDRFSSMLDTLKKENFPLQEITLNPFSTFDIRQLVADTLYADKTEVEELAEILFEKTKGNPFFVIELFKSLYEKNLITFSNNLWNWDCNQIREEVAISNNVIDLMVDKIKELTPSNITILKIAACIGYSFWMKALIQVCDKQELDTIAELTDLSNKGYFIIQEKKVKFIHDKIREATYTLILEEEKAKTHYAIGNAYLKLYKNTDLEENVFTIINQLNQGFVCIKTKIEKERLIHLNHLAGKKALDASAYEEAYKFFQIAIDLLPKNSWKSKYKLTLELYTKLVQCKYLCTHFAEADLLYKYIYKNVKSNTDKIPIIHIQLRQKTSESKPLEAFQIGFAILEELGLKMPNLSKPETVETMFMETMTEFKALLADRSIASLFDLPEMKDPNMLQAIEIISSLGDIAIALKPEMLGLTSILGVNLSLKYGNTTVSPISFVMWGVITNLVFRDYQIGYELGQLSLRLNQNKFSSDLIFGKVFAFYGWNINHWMHHTKHDIEIAKKGYDIAMANGDLVYAGYFVVMPVAVSFYIGEHLQSVINYANIGIAFAEKYQISFVMSFVLPNLFISLALAGKTESLTSFKTDLYDEQTYLTKYEHVGQSLAYFYLRKYQLFYIANEYQNCLDILADLEIYFPAIPQHIAFNEFHFYTALVILALKLDLSEDEKLFYENKFTVSYDYIKLWAGLCEDNFLHQLLLIEAEKARVEGRDSEAMQLYEKSIQSAHKYEYTNNAAIANELAASFYSSKGLEKVAAVYIKEAQYLFGLLGAKAKVQQLEEKYPQLKRHATHIGILDNPANAIYSRTTTTQSNFLDINTVVKASQAISGEIQLGKLLEKMMKILLENAGAERGFFILKENDGWYIEAEGSNKSEVITVLQNEIMTRESGLSVAIVNYVIRANTIVLLDDATKKGMFVHDNYIKEKSPKSILCYPVINQGNIVGVVYLENNLTKDAFTPDRVEILKVLSSQIAVSIENSLLFANLSEKEEEFRTLVNNVNVGVYRNTGGAKGRFVKVNPALVKILGYDSMEDLMTKSIADLYMNPEDRQKFISFLEASGGVCENYELNLKKKDGTPIFAAVSANIKHSEEGIVQWIDGVIYDITEEKKAKEYLQKLNYTYHKFVPKQFIEFLGKKDITEIQLGDQISKEMSVLFTDIRSFTTLSEAMTSEENFKFINSYLKRVAPQIIKNNGFIDKYIGDAIMALFPYQAKNAVDAAIQMLEELYIYNQHRKSRNYKPISIGVGINTGNLTLGIVGDKDRMEGTVISDTVNLASRIEGLTKMYGASILISEITFQKLEDFSHYAFRIVDTVKVKGKNQFVTVIEILNGNSQKIIDLKLSTKRDFEFGIALYQEKDFSEAVKCFRKVLVKDPKDKAAELYLKRSEYHEIHGISPDWEGIETLESK